MGNPFFTPDNPAGTSNRDVNRPGGRLASVVMLLVCSVWVVLSSAAILLTLSDAMPAHQRPGMVIAELD